MNKCSMKQNLKEAKTKIQECIKPFDYYIYFER